MRLLAFSSASAFYKITNLELEIEKFIVSMKYVLLCSAFHMPKKSA
jgi:hypothetical protein